MSNQEWQQRYSNSLLNVFGSPSLVLSSGKGAYVRDENGVEYLDLLAGIAVNSLGHAHPAIVQAVTEQVQTLGHISNFFTSRPQVELAEKLKELAQAPAGSGVFFANSGTEANEAAFKIARRNSSGARTRIIALEGSFHGRTMGALALTSKEKYRAPFEPLPGGVEFVPHGDIEALRGALDDTVAAVFVEPIQGESGVHPLPAGYLSTARALTREVGALLIYDEVQSGIARTGTWFAFQQEGSAADVQPDVMTLAKGLGAGFPIGAVVAFGPEVSSLLNPGQHGTTFGGNPVACAAALATLRTIEQEGLLEHSAQLGADIRATLERTPHVVQVRGEGLLIGFDLDRPIAADLVKVALAAGFIINAPTDLTIRLAPPLIVSREQAESFLGALPQLIETAAEPSPAGA